MKGLATAVIVILVLAVLTMGVVSYLFISGYNPGKQQISREKAISNCQKLCAEDQEKIYQLKGHPGTLDLPQKSNGLMFLRPTSFCSKQYDVQGIGKVYCDRLTTCKVTDGDGDTGYLVCQSGLPQQAGGGGGGGGSVALGANLNQKILQCDKPGSYIKFYTQTNHPLVGSKLRVWGVVCNNSKPVMNIPVNFEWNNYPLSRVLYSMNFENFTEDNNWNKKYLSGWDFNQTFWGEINNGWCKNHISSCATSQPGFLSLYEARLYVPESTYRSIKFSNNIKNVDELDARIFGNVGPGYKFIDGKTRLCCFAGSIPEVRLILSNGTNEKYVHYYLGVKCTPGHYYDKYGNSYGNVNKSDCLKFLTSEKTQTTINNVSIPDNDSNNIYVNLGPRSLNEITRFDWKHIVPESWVNYSLKKVEFGLHVFKDTNPGATGPGIVFDNVNLLSYVNSTKTDKFGMFNISIDIPMQVGTYNLTARSIGLSATGTLQIYPKPTIEIKPTITQNDQNVTISGKVEYLNGTPINNSEVWVIINGKPYSSKYRWYNYTFDEDSNDWATSSSSPAFDITKGVSNGVAFFKTIRKKSWSSTTARAYYRFPHEEYVKNISLGIKPYITTDSGKKYTINVVFYVDDNGIEKERYYWIGRQGSRGSSPFSPWDQIDNYNISNKEWSKVYLTPYNLSVTFHNYTNGETTPRIDHILNNENQKMFLFSIYAYGLSSSGNTNSIYLDNVSIETIGNLVTNSSGEFKLTVPKIELNSGGNTIKIEAIGIKGEKAYAQKSIII